MQAVLSMLFTLQHQNNMKHY